jgi:hypothetical protein
MGKLTSWARALTLGVVIAVGGTVVASGATATTYTVHLKGSLEIPKGSPTGTGTFKYQINTKKGDLCYSLKWSGIGTPFASHIHKAKAGVEGNVVIPLSAAAPVAQSGCVKAKASLLEAILKTPSNYYVNVHTKKYPNGAIRGQL